MNVEKQKEKINNDVIKEHYFSKKYFSLNRLYSYSNQINEVLSLSPKKILEIGIGSGFVANSLKFLNIKVVTMDNKEDLRPDIIADIRNIPTQNEKFDIVLCCEVLEHLPFEDFSKCLLEMKKNSKGKIIISLPDSSKKIRFFIPKIGYKIFCIPFLRKKIRNDHSHFWEINRKGFDLKKIEKEIKKNGFKIEKNYILFNNPAHRFFVLSF
ncbi:MAG: class I SAM-dependent methyltransferase [Patescibacteria group bacterium]